MINVKLLMLKGFGIEFQPRINLGMKSSRVKKVSY